MYVSSITELKITRTGCTEIITEDQ